MTFLLLNGKLSTQYGKLLLDSAQSYAEFVECCCGGCPCGSSPPDICSSILVTLTNKTGSAVCLPDTFTLVWNGLLWAYVMSGVDPACYLYGDVELNWTFKCGVGGYDFEFDCNGGGPPSGHQGVIASEIVCDPFSITYNFSATSSCLCILDVGPPPTLTCAFGFTATLTCV